MYKGELVVDKYLVFLPLGGIIIGWLLNELSGKFKKNFEDTRNINSTLTNLLIIRDYEINLVKSIHEAAKHARDFQLDLEGMESRRIRNNELSVMSSKEVNDLLNKIMSNLAFIDPVLTYEIAGFVKSTSMIEKISMEEVSKCDELYIELVLSIESSIELGITFLDNLILKLSRKNGLRNYFMVKNLLKKKSFDKSYSVIDYIDPEKIRKYIKYSDSKNKQHETK